MKKAILAKKIGMTQIFLQNGILIPVTVLEAGPCTVVQKKTVENDGYNALQVGFTQIKPKKLNKPEKGHFDKSSVAPQRHLKEFRLEDIGAFEVGQTIKADIFAAGEHVDIAGVSKGKGFKGAVRRHGHGTGPSTHGSKYHRHAGSMGAATSPGRVPKGKKLPGHMGARRVTVQNLEIARVDADRNLLLVKGAVPGPRGSLLFVKDTVKVK